MWIGHTALHDIISKQIYTRVKEFNSHAIAKLLIDNLFDALSKMHDNLIQSEKAFNLGFNCMYLFQNYLNYITKNVSLFFLLSLVRMELL